MFIYTSAEKSLTQKWKRNFARN